MNSFDCSQINLQINYKNEEKFKATEITKVTYSSFYSFLNFSHMRKLFDLSPKYADIFKFYKDSKVKAWIKDYSLNKSAEFRLN